MKLSVIIPVFNEKNTIKQVIDLVNEVEINKEIIVVDDSSTDGTKDVLSNLNLPNVRTIFHEKNMGKGAAIRTAIKYITGDMVIIQDADMEYDPQDYYKLIQPIMEGKAEVVYGTRFHKNLIFILWHKLRDFIVAFTFTAGVLFLNILTDVLYRQRITDEATCYKVFKAEVIKGLNLKCNRFEFCPEVTAKVAKKGYKIYEVPISFRPRGVSEGKKINWKDGMQAIWTLIKYRFVD